MPWLGPLVCMLPFQIVCYRLICIAILNFVKIEKIIFMILTHLAFRNCLTTSRCIVISTICSVPRYIYTGDQNVWVFAIFISEMAFSIRTSHLVFQYFAILDKNILWDLVETTILEPKPVNIQNILVSSVKQPWLKMFLKPVWVGKIHGVEVYATHVVRIWWFSNKLFQLKRM